jgi:RNA polymerase sigma factor (TIGR02999 family)
MSNSAKQEITVLLKNLKDGDKSTQDEIMKILYQELRGFAGNILRGENQTITFQATELVNEAYIRMFDSDQLDWTDRTHFLSTAIVVMRRFLVDHARKKNRQKRISKKAMTSFDENYYNTASLELDIVGLDDALTDLEQLDEEQAKIVEMRFFGGLSETEVAKILNVSRSTVKREWKAAKMWLLHHITSE